MAEIASQIENNTATLRGYGFTKQIVVTESSYTSDPPYQWVPGYGDGEDGQARYLRDAYNTMLLGGATLAVWSSLQDSNGTDAYAKSGLIRTDLSEKPAFAAYQQMTQVSQGPLVMSGVTVSVNRHSATIRWTTNRASDSQVEYGKTAAYGGVVTASALTTSHVVTLKGLSRRTTYYFRVTSRAADGSTASNPGSSFRTR